VITLALITARGGSKSIPRKNIKLFGGKPLIAWAIETALSSRAVDDVVVTTDDEEIAMTAKEWGAEVPFLRPAELAADDSPGIDPILHALAQLGSHDQVVVLQPTSPLRRIADVDACVELARQHKAPASVSVSEPAKHPYWMYRLDGRQRMHPLLNVSTFANRQDLPPVYALNGAVYYAQTDWLKRHHTFVTTETVGYIMPPERSLDIDTALDWKIAEMLLHDNS
jgi:CMP-N,N'-diacetyllegionaminic acid synthase